ncbi:DUF3188 domain-containing protein [Enterococcus sp.]|uniref:DUF3188 domain-containing protein n=1 Tax=Enterococcus sp. TaxID=35783 RepID=UPI0028B196BC|nr:DUF3188 domain-containing protein [Enterococcus sp.]
MLKNGLFLCSIGLLVILYSMNPNNLQLDIFSFTTGIALIVAGSVLFMKGKKKAEESDRRQSE